MGSAYFARFADRTWFLQTRSDSNRCREKKRNTKIEWELSGVRSETLHHEFDTMTESQQGGTIPWIVDFTTRWNGLLQPVSYLEQMLQNLVSI